MAGERYRHIVLKESPEINTFTSVTSGRDAGHYPKRDDREGHSNFLKKQLNRAWYEAETEQSVVSHTTRRGIYLEFESDPDFDLLIKSLEDIRSKVRLLNVRIIPKTEINSETGEITAKKITYATVYIPNEKKGHFLKKIEEYAEKETIKGKPKNMRLVNSIADIRKALLVESFWQDPSSLIPKDQPEWCEVWLSDDSENVLQRFEALLRDLGIKAKNGYIRFPERMVKVVWADRLQLERLTTLSDDVAEFRLAKTTSAFWLSMLTREQADWVKTLLERVRIEEGIDTAILILDTGVNNGHPLLSPILADEDCQAVDPDWGSHDHNGHGTLMAGLAAYKELGELLATQNFIELKHRLESVKILPQAPLQNEPNLWGYITSQGVSFAEIQAPSRKRVICMAVTAEDTRDRGRPTSWSSEIDQITSGAEDDKQRLFIVCAGNLADSNCWLKYYSAQLQESIHDPAQSWNALTVGAYTDLTQITESSLSGYKPIAPKGGLSPFTTGSVEWDKEWPIKPEIVMEGGNAAQDGNDFATECSDLSLLSTHWKPVEGYFSPFLMTSAASAQAAWFAAQIQSRYPDFWPETIRALLVHSAKWSDTLRGQFLCDIKKKTECARMLRICGYGVPDLELALYSASNSLTLIAQQQIQPFDKKLEGGFRTREMHLYNLPWPKEALLDLPDGVDVNMRVTLSYFIEPGPGEIGWKDRYRYASHQLRFDINSPGEDSEEFMKRINKAMREENEEGSGTSSAADHWCFGTNARNKGSIHSDIWHGTAAELADSNIIAVCPVIGWWRERSHLKKWNRKTRYSLVVSIYTPEEMIDIYTPVANQVDITVPVTIET